MKISFSALEEARRNPSAYRQKLISGEKPFFRSGYHGLLQATILQYHREGLTEQQARERMTAKYHQRFKLQKGLDEITRCLGEYIEEYNLQNTMATITHQRLRLRVSNDPQSTFEVTGKLPRLDTTSTGYAAWLFSKSRADWGQQLRMPLIQAAIAMDLGAGMEEITVGVYCFEEGRHNTFQFTDNDAEVALAELSSVLNQLI